MKFKLCKCIFFNPRDLIDWNQQRRFDLKGMENMPFNARPPNGGSDAEMGEKWPPQVRNKTVDVNLPLKLGIYIFFGIT